MMEMSYILGEADFAALYRVAQKRQIAAYRAQVTQAGIYYGLPLCLATYALLPDHLYIGIVLLVSLSVFGYRSISSLRSAAALPASIKQRSVRLIFSDEGLREESSGVSSLASWSSIRSFTIQEGAVFIGLANGLWGIVPKSAISDEEELRKIISEFERRGVIQKNA